MVAGNLPHRYRITFTKPALIDLDEITAYIAQTSPQNATAYGDRLVGAIDSLELFPHRNVMTGQSGGVVNPVRTFPFESHIIYFRVNDKRRSVSVLRILHAARRRPKSF